MKTRTAVVIAFVALLISLILASCSGVTDNDPNPATTGWVTISVDPGVFIKALGDRFTCDDVLVQFRSPGDDILGEAVATLQHPEVSISVPGGSVGHAFGALRNGGVAFASGRSLGEVTIGSGSTVNLTVVVGATNPIFTNTVPANGAVITSPSVALHATITDPGGKIPTVFATVDGNLYAPFVGNEWSVNLTGLNDGVHTVSLTANTASGGTGSVSWSYTVDTSGNIDPQFDEWPGHTFTFYEEGPTVIVYDQMIVTVPTPENSIEASVFVFFYYDLDNLEVGGNIDLTNGAVEGTDVGRYDDDGVYTGFTDGTWSSDEAVYNKKGDSDPTTGHLTLPNAYIDQDGDGSAEYSGDIDADQTAYQIYSNGGGIRSTGLIRQYDLNKPSERFAMYQEILANAQ